MESGSVLIINEVENRHSAQLVSFSEKELSQSVNGESGFHIYHVSMLTMLILEELKKSGAIDLSQQEIEHISLASSLHDIGKSKIPKAILDFPGKLSPVEYDIVKKHCVFGKEIISAADFGNFPAAVKSFAIEIALNHHERCDGTGYPNGLKSQDIPISAQVVALADSYDALTSTRNYKEAFSQDVAIQMISSGMCGTFNEELVDALMKVVNHSFLVSLREALYKKRSIVEENIGFKPQRVLCIGNTEYLTQQFIDDAFPGSKVTVVGNTLLGSAEKIKLFKIKTPSIEAIFETYDFDLVVYFSGDLTFRSTEKNDSEELREVLQTVKEHGKKTKIIFLSSLDSTFKNDSDRAILSSAKESLCAFYTKSGELDIKIIQIPYLYSGTVAKDFLYKIFEDIEEGKPAVLEETPKSRMNFLSLSDLSALLFRIIENWKSGSGSLSVVDDFNEDFSALSHKLAALSENAKIDFTGKSETGRTSINNKVIRNEYGWFSKISILEDLEEEYERYLILKKGKEKTFLEKIKGWLEKNSLFVKITELLVLFVLTELLLLITDSAVIFSIVDFRMAYIVIMATVHGLNLGLSAAALSSISWLVAKVASGTNLLTVFYEPTNWLSFVFFFLVAAICGYIKLHKDDNIRFVTEQNKLLEDKLVFIRGIYEDTYREKKDLKKQIIGSKDSFGKIFDITRKLDTVAPQLLYLRTMETFEEVLENKSITVYSVNDQSTFGRLEVASRDIADNVSRSISIETFAPIIEKLKQGEIWRNTDLESHLPMYSAGVYRGDKLILLIFLWHADDKQRSLYYVNLFKILRDLVQMSLLRAFDYNQAVYHKQYIQNTHIMNKEAFAQMLNNHTALKEKKVYTFVLLEVDAKGLGVEEVDSFLMGKIRANDVAGIGEADKIQVILSQAGEGDLKFILPRFENSGFDITVVST